ncbi:MAG: DUF2975 domain-containing protein [Chlamydiales bacterium]|nr:DUF2975 domain-containing protein [Chlamydiales bacterium]
MKKIHSISSLLKWCAIAVCILLPVIEAGYWITSGYPFLTPFFGVKALSQFGSVPITWENLSDLQKFLAFLVNLIPIAFLVAAFAFLSQLFSAFQKGEIFEARNVTPLKRVGWMLMFSQLVHPLYCALLSLTLTYTNPIGDRVIALSLGIAQLEVLLIGLAILLASWVFERAVIMREEQEGVI